MLSRPHDFDFFPGAEYAEGAIADGKLKAVISPHAGGGPFCWIFPQINRYASLAETHHDLGFGYIR